MFIFEARQASRSYSPVAKIFHWLVLALLTAQFAVAWTMPHIGRNTPDEGLVSWHLSLGTALLFVVVLRLVWRGFRPVMPLPGLPGWQRQVATLTHAALYVMLIVMPLLGWAAADFRAYPVKLFGILPLPAIAPKGAQWAHTAGDVHNFLSYVLLAVIALHIVAALYHHYIVGDGVLRRMLPAMKRDSE
jgi:cytochrome b561